MSGHVGNLSLYQENVLREFKEAVADVHRDDYDDYYYLRWLRARDFDRCKAEAMMRKSMLFRKRMGADTLLTDYKPPEILQKYFPTGLLGPDNDGCPVRLLPFKNLDFKGLSYSVTKFDILKYLTYLFEEDIACMKEQSKKLGKVIETHSYVLNIDEYNIRQALNKESVNLLNELVKLYEGNYPERLKVAIFINAPAYFSFALALTKPFLTDVTLKKFKVFGKDGYQECLRTIMPPDIIPASLGGNRRDPDGNPLCMTIVNYGGFVPRSLYFSKSTRNFAEENDVQFFLLKRRTTHYIDIEIAETGSEIQWEVETCSRDVGIGLYYRATKGGASYLEEIMDDMRVNCHLVPESCTCFCEKTGTYVLKFDNSYSWFTSKKIYYRITVITPHELSQIE